ncbi:hypothetical protein HYC85_017569 [Camellia sinensis]|uniref:Uncharacterized protein n=1 Tax=Camellia sinensis TaxID=4442 RepID=A0A7J7GRS5_CAMSI|nr:hypothetical protein HYC85_017569 [Camellia sinensis]
MDSTQALPKSHSEILICGSQQPGLNVITELIIGFMYPGKPLANVAFKTYGCISMSQAIMFLSYFKLGHYMKSPPKSMFVVQLVGMVVASSVYFGTSWWLLNTVENMCDLTKLPSGSPWTCPGDDVFYNGFDGTIAQSGGGRRVLKAHGSGGRRISDDMAVVKGGFRMLTTVVEGGFRMLQRW